MPLNEMCPAQGGDRPSIDREKFTYLSPDAQRLIRQWFERAKTGIEDQGGDPFESFIYAWIAFNGWAACCSGTDIDSAQVRGMAFDTSLAAIFQTLLQDDPDWCRWAGQFYYQWPIFRAAELRRSTVVRPASSDRREVVKHYLAAGISRAPRCYARHQREGLHAPLDWEHTVAAIYQVRCNLFHGEKAAHSQEDRAIVSAAANTLVPFLERLGLGDKR